MPTAAASFLGLRELPPPSHSPAGKLERIIPSLGPHPMPFYFLNVKCTVEGVCTNAHTSDSSSVQDTEHFLHPNVPHAPLLPTPSRYPRLPANTGLISDPRVCLCV